MKMNRKIAALLAYDRNRAGCMAHTGGRAGPRRGSTEESRSRIVFLFRPGRDRADAKFWRLQERG